MGVREGLKQLWKKHRRSKARSISERERRELAERRASEMLAPIAERIEFDEVRAMMCGMALGQFNIHPEWQQEEYQEDIDPRFLVNPNGEGCSKSFENPSSTETTNSSETSPSTPTSITWVEYEYDEQSPSTPKDRESVFDPSTWSGPESLRIDWAEGKRKGRETDDEEDNQESGLNDWFAHMKVEGLFPQIERTKKLVADVRKRAWTC